jgi:hypothetical protein
VKCDGNGQPLKQDRVVWGNQFSTFAGAGVNEVATQGGFMLVVGSNIATPISPNDIVADIQTNVLPL